MEDVIGGKLHDKYTGAVIIGGGVVGLHLARRLAELGVEAELYESKQDVSEGADRASGVLSIRGLGRTGLDYRGAIVNTLNGAYISAGRERIRVRSSVPMAYVLDRGKLAKLCKRGAESAGARIVLGSRISRERMHELSMQGKIIVGADGAVSTVASAFHFPAISDYVLTYKAISKGADVAERDMVGLYFSGEFARGLFGWHVPYSEETVEFGIGVGHRVGMTSRRAFDSFMGSGAADPRLIGRIGRGLASMIPLSPRRITVKGGVALVGDAAGQVKATTGGGIIYGCLSAELLARSIRDSVERGAPLSLYERAWRRSYGADLMLHRAWHSYYSRVGTKGVEWTVRLARMLGLDGFLGRYGDMDSPRLTLKRFVLRHLSD